jgi:hypothetical protein
MTLRQLKEKINLLLEVIEDREAKAQFDFPLLGHSDKYKVVDLQTDGTLILRNAIANRPAGH